MKRVLLLALVMVLVTPMSNAMLISYEGIKETARPGEQTVYNITLNNNENAEYKIYVLRSSNWRSSVFPRYTFDMEAFEIKEVQLVFDVPEDELRGDYLHQVDIKWDDETYSVPLISRVIIEPYGKVFVTSLDVEDIDPRETNYVNFRTNNVYADLNTTLNITLLENNNPVYYEQKGLLVETGGQEFNESFEVPDLTGEGNYTLRVSLFYHGVLDFTDQEVYVQGYTNFSQETNSYVNLFGKRVEVILKNTGTIPGEYNYSEQLYGVDRYLVYDTNVNLNNGLLTLNQTLDSQEYVLIYYNVTFLPIILITSFVVGLFFVFFRLMKRVEVTKNVIDYSAGDLGITLKMQIKVKNLGKGSVKDLKIYDPLPKLSHEIVDYGTIAGKKVMRKSQPYIYWNIEEIKAQDEVILFYELRINIGVIGKMSLAPTEVLYISAGREFLANSNEVIVRITPGD